MRHEEGVLAAAGPLALDHEVNDGAVGEDQVDEARLAAALPRVLRDDHFPLRGRPHLPDPVRHPNLQEVARSVHDLPRLLRVHPIPLTGGEGSVKFATAPDVPD